MKTIKEAIIQYILAKGERLKPCVHEWEFLGKHTYTIYYGNFEYTQWIYRCKKCGEINKFNNESN